MSTDEEWKRFATPMVRDNLIWNDGIDKIEIYARDILRGSHTNTAYTSNLYQPSLPLSGETLAPHVSGKQTAVTAGL